MVNVSSYVSVKKGAFFSHSILNLSLSIYVYLYGPQNGLELLRLKLGEEKRGTRNNFLTCFHCDQCRAGSFEPKPFIVM